MPALDLPAPPFATLGLPTPNLALIAFAKGILGSLTNNPSFPSPTPSLDVFAANIDAFDKAEAHAATRTKGAAAQRNAKKQKVIQDLRHLRDYVQSVAEAQATPAEAGAMIASAGMATRAVTKRSKPPLTARNTGTSGTVLLDAEAVAQTATYYWQYSLDQKTWTSAPETMKARTTIAGLTPAQVYYFRFRALTRNGATDYSQVVSLLVH